MTTPSSLQALEDLLLRFGREELEFEHALKRLQTKIRQLSTEGDDAAADAAVLKYERIRNALIALREHIYRLEAQLYAARRRMRQ